jgi:class 3 adenylate cyclase
MAKQSRDASGFLRGNLGRPSEARQFPLGHGGLVDLGPVVVGRAELQPGWRWSTSIKPAIGTEWCEIHHVHILVRGSLGARMRDGREAEFETDDVFDLPPGHDAWVVGEESAVLLDISGNVGDFAVPVSGSRVVATLLMTDIVGSTSILDRIGDQAWKQRLAEHNRIVRRRIQQFRGREIDTTGDGFLVTFESARAATQAALEIAADVRDAGLEVRAGVHSGEVDLVDQDVRGVTVHATARVMGAAGPSEVLVTDVVRALAGARAFEYVPRGRHQLKGLEEPLDLFAVSRRTGDDVSAPA